MFPVLPLYPPLIWLSKHLAQVRVSACLRRITPTASRTSSPKGRDAAIAFSVDGMEHGCIGMRMAVVGRPMGWPEY
jgi:hypothetical protein